MAIFHRCDVCKKEITNLETLRIWQVGEPTDTYPMHTHTLELCGECISLVRMYFDEFMEHIKKLRQ